MSEKIFMTRKRTNLRSTMNLVNPAWETLDPTPDIVGLFDFFNEKFFDAKLKNIKVEWSRRMTVTAGLCYVKDDGCVIRLSEPLLTLRPRKDLIETLLHEMIHAMLFLKGFKEESENHGPKYMKKMKEINRLAGTEITVHHNFDQEVKYLKQQRAARFEE